MEPLERSAEGRVATVYTQVLNASYAKVFAVNRAINPLYLLRRSFAIRHPSARVASPLGNEEDFACFDFAQTCLHRLVDTDLLTHNVQHNWRIVCDRKASLPIAYQGDWEAIVPFFIYL
jgi:hypothetical protein